jgi:hypothetical protein
MDIPQKGKPKVEEVGGAVCAGCKTEGEFGSFSDVDSANGFSTARSRANSRTGRTGAVEPSTTFTLITTAARHPEPP